jgi:hypothetical protein
MTVHTHTWKTCAELKTDAAEITGHYFQNTDPCRHTQRRGGKSPFVFTLRNNA